MLTKKEKVILCIPFIIFAYLGAFATRETQQQTEPTVLTVCEVLSHASKYDGELVSIRGKTFSTGEAGGFVGEQCPGVLTADGKSWPSVIAWTMPTDALSIIHPVDFKYDWASDKALDKKYHQLRKRHVPDSCIQYTYTGMFERWAATSSRKTDARGTPYQILGFGHLNGAGAQLVLKSADDATPIPNCK
jgi:hypothetical protein